MFTFTLVMNPWDRMVSFYLYRKKRGNLPDEVSFRDYILQFNSPRYKRAKSLHSLPFYYYGLAEYILDKNDKIIVDFVGKYESRETDIKTISQRLDCPSLGHLCLQKAKPLEMHYSQFYDEETKNIVGRVFAQDIELFGYRFES
ncbi:sulfotransferase family 2 domain-containing protein [Coleofasciculus sp. F4-SAH-05]|uniref:sulfotransferase family 2 domain-containing protein n=1 Tax=Coleofasciculus sp. F4-SAH-05 TaxID=3069525 RepID=UPI0032FFFB55